jgi:(p)ppGpp synthase/HD superfamily hydrolase
MKMILPERNPEQQHEIEKAIIFLVTRMQESGHNPKPVIFHSVRVGGYLYHHNYPPEIVKAGILHDIVEDSETPIAEIEEQFGSEVAELVQMNTSDPSKGDRAAQGIDRMQRCLNSGRDALVITMADKLDNSYYLNPALDEDFCKFWIAEMRQLVELSKPVLVGEPIWQELREQCEKLELEM